jgi:hypothetical protein
MPYCITLHHTSIQNRYEGHRLVCRQELPVVHRSSAPDYGSITQTMPGPFARGTPTSSTSNSRKTILTLA